MTGSADVVDRALARLAEAGLDVHGRLSASQWDAHAGAVYAGECRPGWLRTAIVVGGRGGRFALAVLRAAGAEPELDPIDVAVERRLDDASAEMAEAGIRAEVVLGHRGRRDPRGLLRFCDLAALAAEAGLGWPSRLGLLLHPEAGPWMHLRGVLLVDARLEPGRPLPAPAPCLDCPAPCAQACPGGAVTPRFDRVRCGQTRVAHPPCALRCDARRTCVVGPEFRYADEVEAWHMGHAVDHLPGPPASPRG